MEKMRENLMKLLFQEGDEEKKELETMMMNCVCVVVDGDYVYGQWWNEY